MNFLEITIEKIAGEIRYSTCNRVLTEEELMNGQFVQTMDISGTVCFGVSLYEVD